MRPESRTHPTRTRSPARARRQGPAAGRGGLEHPGRLQPPPGLVVSLASAGRPDGAAGFGIPLVVRYLLETAVTMKEAVDALGRVPVNIAYNLTMLDRRSDVATAFVRP